MSVIPPDTLADLYAAAREAPPGDFVEVGVYKGGSARGLAEIAQAGARRLFLFDTFRGIPHADPKIDRHKVGDFGDTSVELVRQAVPTAIIREGLFPDTMDDDVGPIALAHVDCDQYASVKACCEVLGPRMVPGGLMVFDDYDCLLGAKLAVDEAFGSRVWFSRCGKARVTF